jgi:Ca-activated chloride channel family protein
MKFPYFRRATETAAALSLAFAVACACAQAPIARSTQAPIERSRQAPTEHRTQGQPMTTLKLNSRLVTVAVNAVDANGVAVGDLQKNDFRLLEDGKEQKIAYFDRQSTTPLSIVMSIDASDSALRFERLEKQAARRFIRDVLRDGIARRSADPQEAFAPDELDLMQFANSVRELVAFTSDKSKIDAGLGKLTRGESTALYDAIFLASQRLGEISAAGGRRRVLVLITDGGDTVNDTTYDQALEQAQRAGVVIYPLIIVPIYADAGRDTGGEHALIELAHDTGGKYFYINDARDLDPAFEKVTDDLRTQYVLGYYAPESTVKSRRDGLRTLQIEVADPVAAARIQLRYRGSYYGAAAPSD